MVISVNPVHPLNAEAPMVFSVSGNAKCISAVQFSKAYFSMVIRVSGNRISFKPMQFSNAYLPMASTVEGSLTESKDVQFLKAEAPMAVTLYPSMYSLMIMAGSLHLPMPVTVQVFLSAFTVYLSPIASTGSIGLSGVLTDEFESEGVVACSGGRVRSQDEKVKTQENRRTKIKSNGYRVFFIYKPRFTNGKITERTVTLFQTFIHNILYYKQLILSTIPFKIVYPFNYFALKH